MGWSTVWWTKRWRVQSQVGAHAWAAGPILLGVSVGVIRKGNENRPELQPVWREGGDVRPSPWGQRAGRWLLGVSHLQVDARAGKGAQERERSPRTRPGSWHHGVPCIALRCFKG